MAWNSASRAALGLVLLLPVLAACEAAQQIDAAMRRVDVLDRIFAPEPPAPSPQVVLQPAPVAQPEPPPAAPEPGLAKEPEPPPETLPETLHAAAPVSPPEPEPPARVDPAVRRAALIRDNPWLAQFWAELNRAEQARVTRALRRSGTVVGEGAIPSAWDRMGLAERVRLVYGNGS